MVAIWCNLLPTKTRGYCYHPPQSYRLFALLCSYLFSSFYSGIFFWYEISGIFTVDLSQSSEPYSNSRKVCHCYQIIWLHNAFSYENSSSIFSNWLSIDFHSWEFSYYKAESLNIGVWVYSPWAICFRQCLFPLLTFLWKPSNSRNLESLNTLASLDICTPHIKYDMQHFMGWW